MPTLKTIALLTFFWFGLSLPLNSAFAEDIGGDDVQILSTENMSNVSLDIATNGDIYAAYQIGTQDDQVIKVYRSQDDGDTWRWWGTLSQPGWGDSYEDPCLKIIEGYVSRCFLAFRRGVAGADDEIRMVSSSLDLEFADFSTEIVVLAQAGVDYANPSFTSSLADYNWFYLFLAAEGDGPAGTDIWFARSTDLGDSFEPGYGLTTQLQGSANRHPDIAYGIGSNLHLTWNLESDSNTFEDAIRYRRAEHAANDGYSEWGLTQALTSTNSGYYETAPCIEASTVTDEVVVYFQRRLFQPPHAYIVRDPGVMVSTNRGLGFGSEIHFQGPHTTGGIEENPISGEWTIGGGRWGAGINTTQSGNLESWSEFQLMSDVDPGLTIDRLPEMAINPHKSSRAAILWNFHGEQNTEEPDLLMFDGQWRDDPGYPNFAEGFPIALTAQPKTDPALVDVDGGHDLEIVFSDNDNYVHVLDAQGNELPGWPVQIAEELSDSPVAIGDLQNNNQMAIVVGTAHGWVHAFDAQGQEMPGWPQHLETDNPAYVSIGAVGVGYPRMVVVCCGPRIRLFNHQGVVPPNGIGWVMNPFTFETPAAIGDIDGDGIAEIVGTIGTRVFSYQFAPPHQQELFIDMGEVATGAVTLADLDQDGDADILYPAHGGLLHALDDDGSSIGGSWPYQFPGGVLLSSAVVGKIPSSTHPVVATCDVLLGATMLNDDGTELSGYPLNFGILDLVHATPIIGLVEGVLPELIVPTSSGRVHALDHFADDGPGWPKNLNDPIGLSPAIGDIDNDGGTEVVILSNSHLTVLDVLTPPGDPSRTWPMHGHDAQRTGCADCEEDLVSPVPNESSGRIAVFFAGASPNPSQGPSVFHFAVPRDAQIELNIHDLRGRKVASVQRGSYSIGEHFVTWNGHDDQGRRLPSGQYLARLRVFEDGGQEVATRKITILQ